MQNQSIKYTLSKKERLCSKIEIAQLFSKGKKIKAFPLQLSYVSLDNTTQTEAKVIFLASKRVFNRAHKRNKAKRVLRELYRINKHTLIELLPENSSYAIGFSLTSSNPIKYSELEIQYKLLLDLLRSEFEKNTN